MGSQYCVQFWIYRIVYHRCHHPCLMGAHKTPNAVRINSFASYHATDWPKVSYSYGLNWRFNKIHHLYLSVRPDDISAEVNLFSPSRIHKHPDMLHSWYLRQPKIQITFSKTKVATYSYSLARTQWICMTFNAWHRIGNEEKWWSSRMQC